MVLSLNINQHIANLIPLKLLYFNCVQNNILFFLDSGHSTALLLLDLSVAFEIIDHNILLHRLKHWFDISSSALSSLSSFLASRF